MLRAVIGCLVLVSVAGCNRADKQSLKTFLEQVAASLGHRYDDQLKGVLDPEREVRFRVLFARDQLAAADAYLATQPPLGAAARKEVDGYRAAKAEELALNERLLADKRYEPSAAERQREAELQAAAQLHLDAVGRLIGR